MDRGRAMDAARTGDVHGGGDCPNLPSSENGTVPFNGPAVPDITPEFRDELPGVGGCGKAKRRRRITSDGWLWQRHRTASTHVPTRSRCPLPSAATLYLRQSNTNTTTMEFRFPRDCRQLNTFRQAPPRWGLSGAPGLDFGLLTPSPHPPDCSADAALRPSAHRSDSCPFASSR